MGQNENPANIANDPKNAGSQGRRESSGNFASDREKASEAGQKGGQQSSGNFAKDRDKASEAGRKGGSK